MVNLGRLPEQDFQVLYSRELYTQLKGSARESFQQTGARALLIVPC